MSTAIYIGAGLDVSPVVACLDIRCFIYVDAGPYRDPGCIRSRSYSFYLLERANVMEQIGFTSMSGNLYYNSVTQQEIRYYDNTVFPDDLSSIAEWIDQADTLIVAGYDPILPSGPFPFPNIRRVIGNLNTSYQYNPDDKDGRPSICEYYSNRPIDIECLCEVRKNKVLEKKMTFTEFDRERKQIKQFL